MRDRTATLIDTFAAISVPEEFSLSPDGTTVAFRHESNGYSQIFTMPIGRAGWPRQITATLNDCSEPHWSPDGTRIAFLLRRRGWEQLWTIAPWPANSNRLDWFLYMTGNDGSGC